MDMLSYLAALLLTILGVAHSVLGERLALGRLFRLPDLPKLAGSTLYMQRILRVAWHVTSVAWLGLAGIVILLAQPAVDVRAIRIAVGVTALASFAVVLVGTRGKHRVAWAMFLVVSIIMFLLASGAPTA